MRRLLPTLLAAWLLAACGDGGGPASDGEPSTSAAKARVVVAVVDSALTPYHAFYYAGSPIYPRTGPASVTREVLAELGVAAADRVQLTRSGDLANDVAADAAFWGRVEHGKPYWFEGSNIVAISYCEEPFRPLQPESGKNPHGTGTSAAMLKANPEAVLLFVEACEMPTGPDPAALEYALTHPAMDLLSFSYNFGLPTTEPSAYRGVIEFGKLIFQAAGNYPIPVTYQGGAGSWWTIGVSGIDEQANGQVVSAALLPDFVAGFADSLPFCMDCESELLTIAGTSVSTPQAAGLASKILLEARRRLGHQGGIHLDAGQPPAMVVSGERRISNWDLRRALEEAAYIDYAPGDYTPPAPAADLPPVNAIPINPVAPWLQLAWGDLSTAPEKSVATEALARLGFGAPGRQKTARHCQFMAAQMRIRQTYGDLRGTASGELVPADNPHRFCDA